MSYALATISIDVYMLEFVHYQKFSFYPSTYIFSLLSDLHTHYLLPHYVWQLPFSS